MSVVGSFWQGRKAVDWHLSPRVRGFFPALVCALYPGGGHEVAVVTLPHPPVSCRHGREVVFEARSPCPLAVLGCRRCCGCSHLVGLWQWMAPAGSAAGLSATYDSILRRPPSPLLPCHSWPSLPRPLTYFDDFLHHSLKHNQRITTDSLYIRNSQHTHTLRYTSTTQTIKNPQQRYNHASQPNTNTE